MALNILNPLVPAPYIHVLPDGSSITVGGDNHNYLVYGGGIVECYAHDNDGGVPEVIGNLRFWDPFPQGAVALLMTGLSYTKTGNIWLLAPIPDSKPVTLGGSVFGYENYLVVNQNPYTAITAIENPLNILFNISMSRAKTGEFPGADSGTFVRAPDEKRKKITITIDIPLMKPWGGNLGASSQVNAAATKGPLAKTIAQEVEKTFDMPKNRVFAFFEGKLQQEVSFEDLFLVALVQKSKATYQPVLALRVYHQ